MPRTVELPNEIWCRIASYFSSDELRNCVGVNRVFYELGMQSLYGEIVLDTSEVSLLQHPERARQVKSLTIHPGNMPRLFRLLIEGSSHTCGISPWRKLLVKISKAIPAIVRPRTHFTFDYKQTCLSTISSLRNIQTLLLECKPHDRLGFQMDTADDWLTILPVVQAGWTAYASSLRHLKLDIPMEVIAVTLRPLAEFENPLPALQTVEIALLAEEISPHERSSVAVQALLQVLEPCAQTLTKLSLKSTSTLRDMMLRHLRLPCLSWVSLPIFQDSGAIYLPSHLTGFLLRHSNSLETLELFISSANTIEEARSEATPTTVNLPLVHRIELLLDGDIDVGTVDGFQTRFLTSLSVPNLHHLRVDGSKAFCDYSRGIVVESLFRFVRHLDRTSEVRSLYFCLPFMTTQGFCEIAESHLSGCRARELTFLAYSWRSQPVRPIDDLASKNSLFKTLPHLESLNGFGREIDLHIPLSGS